MPHRANGDPTAIGLYKVAFDPDNPQRFFAFALAGPYSEIVAASISARNNSLAVGLLVMVPALGIGYCLSRTLARPLQQIATAAKAFGRRESEIPLPLEAPDEVAAELQALLKL